MRRLIAIVAAAACTALMSSGAIASSISVLMGPPSLGGGGTNPVSIPPQALDLEVVYATNSSREIVVGLVPGILYGFRSSEKPGFYVSAGGGILFNPEIATLGLYTAFGYMLDCTTWCMDVVYRQSVGLHAGSLVTPYAFRLGVAYRF